MKNQILLAIIACVVVSCSQKEIKKVVSSYPNGNPEIVKYFSDKNDSLTFRKEVFYESGKQEYIGNVVRGNKDGIWTWWYENGNKKDQCKYQNGFYTDSVFHWYESGKIKQIEIVSKETVRTDGCCNCNGTIIRYNENGSLNEIFTSLNEKLEGKYTYFLSNGSWVIKTYKNDTLNGETIEHFVDSVGKKIIIIGQYNNGKETGVWKWFDNDSTLYQTIEYQNGQQL